MANSHKPDKPEKSGTRPFAAFEWMLAGRYLRTRRREGFVSVIAGFSFLGIMLGVATLIVVLSVMNGFRKELLEKIVGINGHIFIAPIDRPLTDYAEVADRVSRVAGVRRAIPMVEGQAFASSPYQGSGVLVRGVRGSDMPKIQAIAGNLRQGSLDNFEEGGGVAIGRRLAESLSLQAGDTLTLITPRGAATPFGTAPRIKGYPVAAVFEIGMSEFDATFVYMPLKEAQAYFNREGDVTVIEVFLDNADKVDEARQAIEMAAERPILITDWRQRNRTFFGALEVERNVMFLILSLIVVVVTSIALSLIATLYPSWRAARLDPVQALRYG